MLAIDNAVELIMKTYLGLPRHVTGLNISQSQYRVFSQSFTGLLNAVDQYVSDNLVGVDLSELVGMHRTRDELYREGSGITVVRQRVVAYAEMAKSLFRAFFGVDVDVTHREEDSLWVSFFSLWAQAEAGLLTIVNRRGVTIYSPRGPFRADPTTLLRAIEAAGVLPADQAEELLALRNLRNRLVHGAADDMKLLTQDHLSALSRLSQDLDRILVEG